MPSLLWKEQDVCLYCPMNIPAALDDDLTPHRSLYLTHLVILETAKEGARQTKRERKTGRDMDLSEVEPKEKHKCLYPAVELVHLHDQRSKVGVGQLQ